VVRARAGTGGAASAARFEVAARQILDLGDLALVKGGSLEGRVVDVAGQPVAGARVAVAWQVESLFGVMLPDPDLLPEVEAQTTTDAKGMFALAPLENGRKTVVVATADRGGKVVSRGTVEGPTLLGDIQVGGTGVIAGRVEWDDGKPAADVRVYAVEFGGGAGTLFSSFSAADGSFRLEHLEGNDLRLGAFLPGIPVRTTEAIAPGTLDVVLRIPLVGSVSGRVVRKVDGRPVPRFGVLFEPQDPEEPMTRTLRRMMDTAVGAQGFVSADGSFRVPVLAAGTYVVVVQAAGFPDTRSQPFKVPAGGTGEAGTIALIDGNAVSGIVRTTLGEPVARAALHLVADKGIAADAEESEIDEGGAADGYSDDEGRFALPPQTPGKYLIVVQHRFAEQLIERDVDLRHGPRSDLDLRVKPAGMVHVTLVDAEGRPVPDEVVMLLRPDGAIYWDQTEAEGESRYESVALGPCLVRWLNAPPTRLVRDFQNAADDDARSRAWDALRAETPETVVRAGQETAVKIRLPARVKLTLRITPWSDEVKRIQGVWVKATNESAWYSARRQDDGSFLSLVPAGTYEAYVMPEPQGWDGHRIFKGIEVPDGRAHTTELGR
jgi:uncharacterized GH25 family protein